MAEYMRRLVARDLGEPLPPADPRTLFDLGSSSGGDVATGKDEMVGAAVDHRRRSR